jgi:hypothetical protein
LREDSSSGIFDVAIGKQAHVKDGFAAAGAEFKMLLPPGELMHRTSFERISASVTHLTIPLADVLDETRWMHRIVTVLLRVDWMRPHKNDVLHGSLLAAKTFAYTLGLVERDLARINRYGQ